MFLKKPILYYNYEIVGFVDNDKEKWGTIFKQKKVYSPSDIGKLDFDKIIVCVVQADELMDQLLNELHIKRDKLLLLQEIEESLKNEIINKYQFSQDVEIKKILSSWRENSINIFGYYQCDKNILHQVHYDGNSPYIFFEDKRMYFQNEYQFCVQDNKTYVINILQEQGEHSPHLYVRNENEIPENGVIVDAGVCEGNFALRYIEKVKKAYLIESNPMWVKALRRTFEPYKDKVVICEKFLSRYDTERSIRLDSLVKEKIDFLKMDIEGAEIDALLGAKETLKNSDAKCAICSYHNKEDAEYIDFLLNSMGYDTSASEGYMFFIYDPNIVKTKDFRKGIIYGKKRKSD